MKNQNLVKYDHYLVLVHNSSSLRQIYRIGSGSFVQVRLDEKTINAILTNHHVIKNEQMAVKTLATFNYDGQSQPVHVNLCPDIFFRTSEVGYKHERSHVSSSKFEDVCSKMRCVKLKNGPSCIV